MEIKTKVQCPAKINLTLKIKGKRPDGFHEIESIMQTINLFDYLTISVKESDKFRIILSGTSNQIPYDEKNLVWKAVELFFDNYITSNDKKYLIEIFIEKNIPIAAGLAGGSTDAAGTLFGLNKMFNNPLSWNELSYLCSQLGSDLNLCLEGGKQKAIGRGEILERLAFEKFNLSLIKPLNLGISAGYAYKKFSEKIAQGGSERECFENDLEWAVLDDFTELKKIKELYPQSIMTGSGSTYFVIEDKFRDLDGFWIKNNLSAIDFGVQII